MTEKPGALPLSRRNVLALVTFGIIGIIALAVLMFSAGVAIIGVARFAYRSVYGNAAAGYLESGLLFSIVAALSGAVSWYCKRLIDGDTLPGAPAAGTSAVRRIYSYVAAALGVAVLIVAMANLVLDATTSLRAQQLYLEAIVVDGIFAVVGLTIAALHLVGRRR